VAKNWKKKDKTPEHKLKQKDGNKKVVYQTVRKEYRATKS
jgi:hypothetical protein